MSSHHSQGGANAPEGTRVESPGAADSEELLRFALEAARTGTWDWDLRTGAVQWSEEMNAIHGIDGFVARSHDDFLVTVHPSDRDRVRRAVDRAVAGDDQYHVEYRLDIQGPPRWVEARGRVIRDHGVPIRMAGVSVDITARKRAEALLEARVRQQKVVTTLGRMALRGGSMQKLLDEAVRRVARVLNVDLCKVLERRPDAQSLLVRAGVGWHPGVVGELVLESSLDTQAGYTLWTDEPVIVEDLLNENRFSGHRVLHEHGVVSGLSVVVGGEEGSPFGVLAVHSRRQRRFTQDDVHFLDSVGNVLASAIQRQRTDVQLRARLGQQRAVAELGHLAAREKDLDILFEKAVHGLAETLEADLAKIQELLPGGERLLLRAGVGWHRDAVGSAVVAADTSTQAGFTLAERKPVIVEDLAGEVRFSGPKLLFDHGVVSGVTVVIAGENGRPYGVLGVHTRTRRAFTREDVAFLEAMANVLAGAIQRRRSDERQQLLMRELNHRVKNMIAVVQALATTTLRGSADLIQFEEAFNGRLMALARAHEVLIGRDWREAELAELAEGALAPYAGRFDLDMPRVVLRPEAAVAVGLVFHELVTNAVKYGALAKGAEGRIAVCAQVLEREGRCCLRLEWNETGAGGRDTDTEVASGEGFGSQLVKGLVEIQLGGRLAIDVGVEGIVWLAELPADEVFA